MYDRILVPTDGSETAEQAFEHALDLAKTYDAELHVINVVDISSLAGEFEPVTIVDELEDHGEQVTSTLAERAEEAGIDHVETAVAEGIPHKLILEYVGENDVNLVVLGTHGRTGLDRYLLGSVTEKVVRQSDAPVLTVRKTDEE